MKPRSSILADIYVFKAKIIDLIFPVLVVAKNPLPAFTVYCSKTHPSWLVPATLVLGVLPLGVYGQTHGTAIMIAKAHDEVTVAADSQTVNFRGEISPRLECKIRRFGNAYATTNGLSTSSTGFDAFRVLNQASRSKGGILSKIAKFEKLAKPQLARAFESTDAPIARNFQANFIGFLKGIPFLMGRRAIIKSLTSDGPIVVEFERQACPGETCDQTGNAMYYAPAESILRFIQTYPNRGYRDADDVVVRAFVQMNIDIGQQGVGPPIDVLRITKDGACWVPPKTKKDCDDPKIEICETKQR